jgi:hypothetical protein
MDKSETGLHAALERGIRGCSSSSSVMPAICTERSPVSLHPRPATTGLRGRWYENPSCALTITDKFRHGPHWSALGVGDVWHLLHVAMIRNPGRSIVRRTQGSTVRVEVDGVPGTVTVGRDSAGCPVLIEARVGRHGSCLAGLLAAWSEAATAALRTGVPLETLLPPTEQPPVVQPVLDAVLDNTQTQ